MVSIFPLAECWFDLDERPSLLRAPVLMSRYLKEPVAPGIVLKSSRSWTTVVDLSRPYDDIRTGYNRRTKRGLNKFDRTDLELRRNDLSPDQVYAEVEAFIRRKGYADPPKKKVYRNRWPFLWHNYVRDPSNGAIVCLQVYFVGRDTFRCLYITNNPEYADISSDATRAIHDDAIQYMMDKLTWYDLGGIVLDEEDPRWGISQFKMGFGGETQETYSYVSINV